MALSELNRRRWRNFRRNGRAFWSLVIFSVLFVLAMFAEVVANDKPIVASYRGELYFPAYRFYPETAFGGDFGTEAIYRDPAVQCLIVTGGREACTERMTGNWLMILDGDEIWTEFGAYVDALESGRIAGGVPPACTKKMS